MAQLLYLSKRARPDIQLAVSLLCNIVRVPDTDDYKNLARVTKYIHGTIGLPMMLSIDKSVNIKWYVDTVFAVHKYMRSHDGGFTSMVTGIDGNYPLVITTASGVITITPFFG